MQMLCCAVVDWSQVRCSSPVPLAEPSILPLIPLIAGNALVAPLHALRIDLVFGREEAGVVVAVESFLPVGDEGSTLKKKGG